MHRKRLGGPAAGLTLCARNTGANSPPPKAIRPSAKNIRTFRQRNVRPPGVSQSFKNAPMQDNQYQKSPKRQEPSSRKNSRQPGDALTVLRFGVWKFSGCWWLVLGVFLVFGFLMFSRSDHFGLLNRFCSFRLYTLISPSSSASVLSTVWMKLKQLDAIPPMAITVSRSAWSSVTASTSP